MATNRFTKEQAQVAKEALDEMYRAFSRNKQIEFIGHLNDIALFIESAQRVAPSESELASTQLSA